MKVLSKSVLILVCIMVFGLVVSCGQNEPVYCYCENITYYKLPTSTHWIEENRYLENIYWGEGTCETACDSCSTGSLVTDTITYDLKVVVRCKNNNGY